MGESHVDRSVSKEELREFSRVVLRDLEALRLLIESGRIETGVRRLGAEQEVFLVDNLQHPAPVGPEILAGLDDPRCTTELGRFNVEVNLTPRELTGACFRALQEELDDALDSVDREARKHGARAMLTGILPTLTPSHLTLDYMTPNPRYFALNDAMNRLAGGRPYSFYFRGRDELRMEHDNVMFEACNTSFQVHLQVGPGEFARLYNLAQVVAAPVLAVAVNSPLLFGRQLWRETRIALFEQSVDTRSRLGHPRRESRRVRFGERWLDDSVLEIFQEDVARFASVLTAPIEEDSIARVEAGEAPALRALTLHNGTVYRWNRACYGVAGGVPHLRIENRVLPAGPSTVDEVANAAFWLGLMVGMDAEIPDVRTRFDFEDARENFVLAARFGLDTQLSWDGAKRPVREIVLDSLLELAGSGLRSMEVDGGDVDRYLEVIRARVDGGRTGAQWQVDSLDALREKLPQSAALEALVRATVVHQSEGEPVASWPIAEPLGGEAAAQPIRVEQVMSTDLFTVTEDEVVDLVASLMKWRHIRRVPVEDAEGRLVGLVTYRSLLDLMARGRADGGPVAVREILRSPVTTVEPSCLLLDAARTMIEERIGCLPVVDSAGRLVGILTEHDLLALAWPPFEKSLLRGSPE